VAEPGTTTAKGRDGEDLAALHLAREGYVVVGRNVRTRGGELDIVARDGDVLCFIEVRRRKKSADALVSVNGKKQHRVARAAQAYLAVHHPVSPPVCRFDVVIVGDDDRVDVLKNAFEARA
jgi:putative endonuclease